jgi:hypothetical protein
MNRWETERILDIIHRVRASGERAALATVVRVKGSAYRREGARIFCACRASSGSGRRRPHLQMRPAGCSAL